MKIMKIKQPNGTIVDVPFGVGAKGKDGKSAYQYAQDGGYTGTEEAFADDINPDTLKAELNAYIAEELAKRGQLKPEFANDISQCTDTSKLYVLPDGYIYAYSSKGGTVQLPLTSGDYVVSNVYDGVLSNEGTAPRVTLANPISLEDCTVSISCDSPYQWLIYYSEIEDMSVMLGKTTWTSGDIADVMKATLSSGTNATAKYIRISFRDSTNPTANPTGLIDTYLQSITVTKSVDSNGWTNTGHAFVPADYEDRIIALDKKVEEIEGKISENEEFLTLDQYNEDLNGASENPLIESDFVVSNVWEGVLQTEGTSPRVVTKNVIPLAEFNVSISCKSPYQWLAYFGTSEDMSTGFIGQTTWTDGNIEDITKATISSGTSAGATHVRISLRDGSNPTANPTGLIEEYIKNVTIDRYTQPKEILLATRKWVESLLEGMVGGIEDVPDTLGQMACLARAAQMRDIYFRPKEDLYMDDSVRKYPAMYRAQGIWYSSVRGTEWGFIGYGVSMYSLMTAINNPKSIIYTKRYSDYFSADTESNGAENVYGTNCSSYVSYCLDLPYLAVTNVFPHLPYWVDECGIADTTGNGMCWRTDTNEINIEALQKALRLGDFLIGTGEYGSNAGHGVIVTGIRRNKNRLVQEVDISDSWWGTIRRITYTWDAFVNKFITVEKYRVYRYAYMDDITFPENLNRIAYSDICTNRGDKISIRPNQDISLNVLSVGNYTGIALFKDGVLLNTMAISVDSPDWELTGLSTGKYIAIVYSGTTPSVTDANEKNSTSFIVCNVSVNRNGDTFTYSAEPLKGIYPVPMQIAVKNDTGFTLDVKALDGTNFDGSGSTEFVLTDYQKSVGSIIHIPFKTEYGFVIAENEY